MNRLIAVLCLGLILSLGVYDAKAEGGKMAIQEGRQVSLSYTLTVEGEIVDSSKERGPLQYTHGKGEIIPGLAKRLEGLQAGDEKVIEVPPEEAYGKRNPQAFREIPKTSLPEGLEPKVGMLLQAKGPEGRASSVIISEIKENSIVLDLNHPLAGKTLTFQVKIVSVK